MFFQLENNLREVTAGLLILVAKETSQRNPNNFYSLLKKKMML